MKKSRLLNIIFATALALTAGRATAQSIVSSKSKIPESPKKSSLSSFSVPSMDVTKISGSNAQDSPLDYTLSYAQYNSRSQAVETFNSTLTNPESNAKIAGTISDIENGGINSQSELINSSKDLSENEKLVEVASISGLLQKDAYSNSRFKSIPTPESGFLSLQGLLKKGYSPFGVCDQIAGYSALTAKDLGLTANAVSGNWRDQSHIYLLVKTKEGLGIINYGHIFLTKTNNIEKALNTYQKSVGETSFEHMFQDQKGFTKYVLWTPDGKSIMGFTGYDPTLNPFIDSLLNGSQNQQNLEARLVSNGTENSREVNFRGFFVKDGKIFGSDISPLVKANLAQIGFRRNFYIPDWNLTISPEASIYGGTLNQEHNANQRRILGEQWKIGAFTNNKKGLNFGIETKGNSIERLPQESGFEPSPGYPMLSDSSLIGGISYVIPLEKVNCDFYGVMGGTFMDMQYNNLVFHPIIRGLEAGVDLKAALPGSLKVSTNPYFLKTEGQIGGGARLDVKGKNVELDFEGSAMASTYDFAPNTYNVSAEFGLNLNDAAKILVNFNSKTDDYNGAISRMNRIYTGVTIKK